MDCEVLADARGDPGVPANDYSIACSARGNARAHARRLQIHGPQSMSGAFWGAVPAFWSDSISPTYGAHSMPGGGGESRHPRRPPRAHVTRNVLAASQPLNSGRIDAKPCSDPAHALCAPRLVQSPCFETRPVA